VQHGRKNLFSSPEISPDQPGKRVESGQNKVDYIMFPFDTQGRPEKSPPEKGKIPYGAGGERKGGAQTLQCHEAKIPAVEGQFELWSGVSRRGIVEYDNQESFALGGEVGAVN
jgi:hypothetical protein